MSDIEDFKVAVLRLAEPERPEQATLYRVSAPGADEMEAWQGVWSTLDPTARRDVARHLLASSKDDFQVDYTPQFTAMLDDDEPEVRALGVDGLWERYDMPLMRRLVDMLGSDTGAAVRARAAAALGRFVERAQLGKLDEEVAGTAVAALLDAAADESEETEVRRRALESAAYSEDPGVIALIDEAIESHESVMRAGALRAMGNSFDDRWAAEVVAHLDESAPELLLEAAHAAGELAIPDAVPALVELACGDDRSVQLEAIWALGEIGGRDARRAVETLLAELEGDDQVEALEDALATIDLAEGELPWSGLDDELIADEDLRLEDGSLVDGPDITGCEVQYVDPRLIEERVRHDHDHGADEHTHEGDGRGLDISRDDIDADDSDPFDDDRLDDDEVDDDELDDDLLDDDLLDDDLLDDDLLDDLPDET